MSAKGRRFSLEFGNGQRWMLYANASIEITVAAKLITASAPYSGSLR